MIDFAVTFTRFSCQLDVVFAAGDQLVWAVDASNGVPLGNFPVRVGGFALGDVTAVRLDENSDAMSIALVATDGYLYVIDGRKPCVSAVDVGSSSVAAPLVDDVDNDGKLDVLVITHLGDVFAFATDAAAHPLSTAPDPARPHFGRFAQAGVWFDDKLVSTFDGVLHVTGHVIDVHYQFRTVPKAPNATCVIELRLGPGGPLLASQVW